MWQAIVVTTVIGLFAVVFLTGLSLIGLEADPPGERTERPTPPPEEGAEGEEEEGESASLNPRIFTAGTI